MHIQDGKLYMEGEAPSEDVKNDIWNKIKAVDATYSDLTLNLRVNPALQSAQQSSQTAAGGSQTYTVKSGDTLSKIAKQFYGDAGQYMKIFDANKDKLKDPDQIQVGQELKIPS